MTETELADEAAAAGEEGLDEVERNALWAGEDPRSLEELGDLAPEEGEELLGWLQSNEPDIHGALLVLLEAAVTLDEVMLDDARAGLLAAPMVLEGYEPLNEPQVEELAERLKSTAGGSAKPEHELAIAIAQARSPGEGEEEEEDEDEDTPDEAAESEEEMEAFA